MFLHDKEKEKKKKSVNFTFYRQQGSIYLTEVAVNPNNKYSKYCKVEIFAKLQIIMPIKCESSGIFHTFYYLYIVYYSIVYII